MSDFIIQNNILTGYTGADTEITVPAGVTTIGEGAFWGCAELVAITLPESVTEIGELAFDGCERLASVTATGRLERIGREAFCGCTALATLTLAGGVRVVEDYAFYRCSSLVRADLSICTEQIGSHALASCDKLTTLALSESLTTLASDALHGSPNLRRIIAPRALCEGLLKNEGVRVVMGYLITQADEGRAPEDAAFFDALLAHYKKALLPLLLSDAEALEGYLALGHVAPDEIDGWIARAAEGGNETVVVSLLKTRAAVQLHKDVSRQLEERPQLEIEVARDKWRWETVDEVSLILTDYKGSDPSIAPPSIIGKLPVTTIGASAFSPNQKGRSDGRQTFFAEKLTTVKLPEGITELGAGAFTGCKALTEVKLPQTLSTIGNVAFSDCKALTTLTIPSRVTALPDGLCFRCKALTEVALPEGLTAIGDFAFSDCTALTSVTIPASVTTIGDFTFANCPKLTLHVTAGSYAEAWAKEKGIKFEAM